jgi:hypothetical protein
MIPSSAISSPPKGCHPERGLAESEANRQTQSKDPYRAEADGFKAGNFRVVVRFFDNHETEQLPVSSREAAECESPARKCRVTIDSSIESRRDVILATTKRQ